MQFSLLVDITQRGDSYVHNGDWIWLQQNITSLVLVCAPLQIIDALFNCCKVQLFYVSWNIIFMLHKLVHVAGRDPDMSHLLDVQWNFSVASLIVACRGGCERELYCSQSAVDSDLDSSHSLRCTGCKNESSWRSAHWKFVDIFLVAARAVTCTMLRYKKLKTHGASQGK
jgi:hypothetical protein